MTKLQRKRAVARYLRLFRRHDQALLNFHVALDPKHEWMVSRSAYHSKRPRWLYCRGRKGQEQSFVRDMDRIDRADPSAPCTCDGPAAAPQSRTAGRLEGP